MSKIRLEKLDKVSIPIYKRVHNTEPESDTDEKPSAKSVEKMDLFGGDEDVDFVYHQGKRTGG